MKVLYVVGASLTKNTSANMSHNGYVQGLLENGCDVDILMAADSCGADDKGLPIWEAAHYFTYASASFPDKIRKNFRGTAVPSQITTENGSSKGSKKCSPSWKSKIRALVKKTFYFLFPSDPVYPLEHTWLKKASRFRSDIIYDFVVSNSSPAASHKLVKILLDSKHIRCKRWVQIWEDPWYADLYGGHHDIIRQEEHTLLRAATEIYYVSPLTLKYQQQLYSDCSGKMKHIPLPYLTFGSETQSTSIEPNTFGYFGDYYSKTRNLEPFYHALCQSGMGGYIYGDSDLTLAATPNIEISGRVTLDKLDEVQKKTGVLVHLCNLRGGQIPGKVYHYSATYKPILFILDGTVEEQQLIKSYFEQFNRYFFCKNTSEDILKTMEQICAEAVKYAPVEAFSPKIVVEQLLCN